MLVHDQFAHDVHEFYKSGLSTIILIIFLSSLVC